MLGEIVEAEPALAFGGAAAAEGDQPRQATVGSAIGGPKHDRRGVVGGDLGADDQFQADVLGGPMCPDHAGQTVAVGNRQRRYPNSAARPTSSSACDAPSRKEKFVLQCNSAYMERNRTCVNRQDGYVYYYILFVLAVQQAEQVLAVAVVEAVGQGCELLGGDEALVEGDLFEAGDLQALALFDRRDEVGRLEQRSLGAGVEPGEAAAEQLDVELALLAGTPDSRR